jgi:hypothetical protein
MMNDAYEDWLEEQIEVAIDEADAAMAIIPGMEEYKYWAGKHTAYLNALIRYRVKEVQDRPAGM